MTAPEIVVDLDAGVVECGDVLAGEVRWDAPEAPPRQLVVSLRFRTAGSAVPPDEGGPPPVSIEGAPSGRVRFELAVPATGPITFTGRTITVTWHVEVALDIAAGPDPVVVEPVTVLPAGGLGVWARHMAAPPTPDPDAS